MRQLYLILLPFVLCGLTDIENVSGYPLQTDHISPEVAQADTVQPEKASPELTEAEKREQMAVDRFWNILERSPRRGTALERVYDYHVDTEQLDVLVERCRKAAENDPDSGHAQLLLGLVLARRGQDKQAIEAFSRAESLSEDDPLPSYYLGETLVTTGRLQDAAEALERAMERKPGPSDALPILQLLGRVYERFGEQEKSQNVWQRMEELFPNDLDILARIAETLEEEGLFEQALERYESLAASKLADDYARVRFAMAVGDMKIRLGRKQEAIQGFEALLESLAPESWLYASVRDRIERVFVRQADYAGLAAYYQRYLKLHPNDLDVMHRLVVAMVRLGRRDEAKELLVEGIEKAPSDINLRLALIDLLVNDKSFDRVDEYYSEINKIEPNNPDYISQWGLAILKNQKLDEETRRAKAAEVWERLLNARPDDTATIIMVADLMNGAQMFNKAEALYQHAIRLQPSDTSYYEYLGYFYHQQKRYAEASKTLRKIAEGSRHSAENLMQLSGILQGLGKEYTEESIAMAAEACELAPDDFELHVHYASILLDSRKYPEAKVQLQAVESLAETDLEYETWAIKDRELLNGLGTISTVTAQLENELKQIGDEAADHDRALQWWRLALLKEASANPFEAKEPIQRALACDSESLLVLRYAANLYPKINEHAVAVPIYENLVSLDRQNRVEHLKSLALLYSDLGEVDHAIETGRLVMATGAKNPVNSRFYAEMLMTLGHRDDGIRALRRAVRIDPTDLVSLSALADALANDDQTEESIELMWRLFERTDDLAGKIDVVDKLAEYYVRVQRLDQLIERLRSMLDDPVGRREAAYCLAQAYASVSDFHAARRSLELLLNDTETDSANDSLLLVHLSEIAEKLHDTTAAIRYQEMLCDLTKNAKDRERLIGLYYKTGQKDMVATYTVQYLLSETDINSQLKSIDQMMKREDYKTAETVIDHLLEKMPNHWEVIYRKAELDFRLGRKKEMLATFDRLIAMSIADNDASEKIKNGGAVPHKPAMSYQPASPYAGIPGFSQVYYQPQQGTYYLSRSRPMHSSYNQQYSNHPEVQYALERQIDLVYTVFRDKLQTDSNPFGGVSYGSSGTGSGTPPKPQWMPENFGEAKFAVLVWKLRLAFDDEENAIQDILDEIEQYYPENSTDPVTLQCRLNTLILLEGLGRLAQYEEVYRPLAGKKQPYQMYNKSKDLNIIVLKLAMAGEKDWETNAFSLVLNQFPPPNRIRPITTIPITRGTRLLAAGEWFVKNGLNRRHPGKQQGPYGLTYDETLDWLLRVWEKTAENYPKEMGRLLHYRNRFEVVLRQYGRETDAARLDTAIELAGQKESGIYFGMACLQMQQIELADTSSMRMQGAPFGTVSMPGAPNMTTVQISNNPEIILYYVERMILRMFSRMPDIGSGMMIEQPPRDEMIATMHQWIHKAVESPDQKNTETLVEGISNQLSSSVQSQWNSYFSLSARKFGKDSSLTQPGAPLEQSLNNYGYVFNSPNIPIAASEPGEETDSNKVTEEEWQWLSSTEKMLFESLDFYFDTLRQVSPMSTVLPQANSPQRSQLQNLMTQLENYLQQGVGEETHEQWVLQFLQEILNPRNRNSMGYSQPDTPLSMATLFFMNYDTLCDEHEREAGHLATYQAYIEKQRESGDPLVLKILGQSESPSVLTSGDLSDYRDFFEKECLGEPGTATESSQETTTKIEHDNDMMIGLICLKFQAKKFDEGLKLLDAMKLVGADEIKSRERIVLALYSTRSNEELINNRAKEAIDRLVGFRQSESELISLRRSLQQFGRNKQADAITKRLLATAHDPSVLYQLLNEKSNFNDETKGEAVAFALRVFRMPQISNLKNIGNDDIRKRVRDQAINILKKAGKLDVIVEQLEMQWESSPQSSDLMWMLADIYSKMNRKSDLQKMTGLLEKQVPDDAREMQDFARLLTQVGKKDLAGKWNTKALQKDPSLLFQNFYQYERTFSEAGNLDELIKIVREIDPVVLKQKWGNFSYRIGGWLNTDSTAKEAKLLFEHLWNLEADNDGQRTQFRRQLLQGIITSEPTSDLYPYYKETFLAMISPPEPSSEDKNQGIVRVNRYSSVQNPHAINTWGSERVWYFSGMTIDCAIAAKSLDELKTKVETIVEKCADPEKKKDTPLEQHARYAYAMVMLALIEMKQQSPDKAVAIVNKLREDKRYEPFLKQSAHALASEFEKSEQHHTLALSLYEDVQEQQQNDSTFTEYVLPRMIPLYLKSDNPAKGKQIVIRSICDSVKYLKMIPQGQDFVRVGNQHYYFWQLLENIGKMSQVASDSGCAFDVWQIYSETCKDQSWYSARLNDTRYQYYTQNLKGNFDDSLLEKITVDDFMTHMNSFIPLAEDLKNSDDTSNSGSPPSSSDYRPIPLAPFCYDNVVIDGKSYAIKDGIPSEVLDAYTQARRDNPEYEIARLVDSKLLAAFRKIAVDDPQRLKSIQARLELLSKEHGNKPDLLLAAAFAAMAAGDHAAEEESIARCYDLLDQTMADGNSLSNDTLMASWLLLKEISVSPDPFSNELTARSPQIMKLVVRYLGLTAAEQDAVSLAKYSGMRLDIECHAPDSLKGVVLAGIEKERCLRMLSAPGGGAVPDIQSRREEVATAFRNGVRAGYATDIMEAFTVYWKNRWPMRSGSNEYVGREECFSVLYIFDEYMKTVSEQMSDKPIEVFDSLLNIVLPPHEPEEVFLAMHGDFGGRDGFFRSLAEYLVESAIAEGKVDRLLEQVAERRANLMAIKEPTSYHRELILECDVIEFVLALNQRDTEKIDQWHRHFLEQMQKDRRDETALWSILALAPAYSDPELLPMVDELLDEAVSYLDAKDYFPRSYYYSMHKIIPNAIENCSLKRATSITNAYRRFHAYRIHLNRPNGFLFIQNEKLYQAGLDAIDSDDLAEALAVLVYFGKFPAKSQYRKNMNTFIDALELKLAEHEEAERVEILGEIDLDAIRKSQANIPAIEQLEPLVAKTYDLPLLPSGTVVFDDDFQESANPAWSSDLREISKLRNRIFFGQFHNEAIKLNLSDLPAHKYLRIRFELLLMCELDGIMGVDPTRPGDSYGPDRWDLYYEGGSKIISTTFSNYDHDQYAHKQSYPDDFPIAFGVKPEWNSLYEKSVSGDLWGEELQLGFGFGRNGADLVNSLGYSRSAIYAIDLVIPHDQTDIQLVFKDIFEDGRFGNGTIALKSGECWGIDNVRVEAIDTPWRPTEEELDKCWKALITNEPAKAQAARWRLVAAGDRTIDYLEKLTPADGEDGTLAHVSADTKSFYRFRVERVLELIGTDRAKELRKRWFGPELSW